MIWGVRKLIFEASGAHFGGFGTLFWRLGAYVGQVGLQGRFWGGFPHEKLLQTGTIFNMFPNDFAYFV